jgi:hypothetical protein
MNVKVLTCFLASYIFPSSQSAEPSKFNKNIVRLEDLNQQFLRDFPNTTLENKQFLQCPESIESIWLPDL